MPGDQDPGGKCQAKDVPAVETDQGCRTRLSPTHQYCVKRITDQGDGFDQVGSGHQRPMNALVPAQDVTGKIQQDGQHQESHPQQVVEATRRSVCTGENHTQEMDERDDHQELRRPDNAGCAPVRHRGRER